MNTLTPSEVHVQLSQWSALGRALNRQFEAFHCLTGAGVESPMWDPVFRLWEAHTESVASIVGDQSGWLSWFDLENEMGARGHEVEVNGEKRAVKTLSDLVWVLTGADL